MVGQIIALCRRANHHQFVAKIIIQPVRLSEQALIVL